MINTPKIGMKLSKAQWALENGEFSLLNNGNIQSPNGDFLVITNEQSNLLCSSFKEGYKVIGVLPINIQNRTVFFLVNPLTGDSEIGYINNLSYDDVSDPSVNCDNCNKTLTEKELDTLKSLCSYHTIVNASCLNFDINHPISATYEIGIDVLTGQPDENNTTIFFADDLNPRRYLNINNYPKKQIGSGECNQPIYSSELDCEAIKVVKEYQQPCFTYIDTPIGGSNKAGVYQFAMAYSTEPNPIYGNPLTDYSYITNPISLSSKTRVVTVNTDYNTDKAIKFQINNIDQSFQWINLVVIKTVNSLTEAFIVDTLPINSDSITYTYTGNNYQEEVRITFEELQKRRAIYSTAKGVTNANRHLLWFDLKDQREINLQPVVNNIPLQWQTIEAKEGFYSNPLSADFVSYERDEVVPFGIEFHKSNGYKSPVFLFIGRDKQYYQDTYNLDVDQIQTGDNVLSSTGCEPTPLNKLWQVKNIAQPSGISSCYSNPTGDTTVTVPVITFCASDTWMEGETPLSPCDGLLPSGDCNPESDTYSCCEIVTVIPSGTVEIPIYNCQNITLENPLPIMVNDAATNDYTINNPLIGEDIPSYNENSAAGFTWIPQSNLCSNSRVLYPSTNNSCSKESLIAEDIIASPSSIISLNRLPYILFSSTGATTVPAGGQTYCDGTVNTPSSNSYWFNFQASSPTHFLRAIVSNNYVIKVFEGGDCDNLTLVENYNSGAYPTCAEALANQTTCITLNNLIQGNTYYIQIFISDTDPVGANGFAHGNICLNTPTPDSFELFDQPAVYRWECNYKSDEEVYVYPADPTCFTTPYTYGDFSYWESSLTYPNNKDVWGDLCGQPIRHFKFPDSCVSHIHNHIPKPIIGETQITQGNKIYPIGVKIDINDIKQALTNAVNLGLISQEEKFEFTGFSIKRGNRRNNRSVIAKGLLYDIWKTRTLDSNGEYTGDTSRDYNYYPNYPYNDLNDDVFLLDRIDGSPIEHPYSNSGYTNIRYTFHSPNTSFNKPELGDELKLETVEYGNCYGNPSRVDKHAEYTLLTKKAYDVAKSLASLQINHEASMQAFGAGDSPAVLGTSGGSFINYIIFYVIGLATGFTTNYGKYVSNWLDIIKNLGEPRNPAIYLTSIGNYNNYCCVPYTKPKRRSLTNYRYLDSGNYEFSENGEFIKFNNFQRESSVYLSINKEGSSPFNKPNFSGNTCNIAEDESRATECVLNQFFSRGISSYYGSIKRYIPDQYGTVDQIEWIDTGYCGIIDWDASGQTTTCDTIFGGDTYINKFALKRKMPYFIQDAVGLNENDPIMYQNLSNVGFPRYFFNSLQNEQSEDKFGAPFFNPPVVEFDCDNSFPFYYRGKFYLYNYGIPYFFCESDYNVDLRHAEDDGNYKDFYPHVADVVSWTQQYKNPISFDNTYYYNVDYSKQNRENFFSVLPESWDNSYSNLRANYPNRVIYSPQGVNNWLENRIADSYDFPFEDGRVIGLNPIEQQAVLVRQENSSKVFNAFITMQSSLATIAITAGEMFQQKPREYYRTDLGYGGSSHRAFTSTPFGHFWVDTQNSSIFQLQGDGLKDITRDQETHNKIQWFTENLPFNIIKDFPSVDIDNAFKYFGVSITWDNKYDRVFITKKDYKLKKEYKGKVSYQDNNFFIDNLIIFPDNTKYFEDKSFTIAYSPLLQNWMSFYDFKPNYYISLENYFQSGINFGNNTGVYSHLLTNKHYQTFYGITYPFIIEYSEKSQYRNKILTSIGTNVDFQRYQENLSYFTKDNVFYDKVEVYNQNQATGNLFLTAKQKNNLQQLTLNNKVVSGGVNVLAENIGNTWWFSAGLTDKSYNNGQPLYTYQSNPYKELNLQAINLNPVFLRNQLLSDWFSIRFTNNKSAYRIEHKFNINNTKDV